MSKEGVAKIDAIIAETSAKTKEAVINPAILEELVPENVPEIAKEEVTEEKEPKKEPVKETKPTETKSSTSDIEKEARLRGWRPLGEYDGDEKHWRSAEEYLEVGKIYDQQESTKLRREINSMQQQMSKVLEINQKQAERLAQEKADYLEAARLQAIQEANVDQVKRIDDQLTNVKQELNTYKKPAITQEALMFQERNKDWFNTTTIDNMQLMRLAVDYENQLAAKQPDLSVEQRLEMTEKAVKESDFYRNKYINKNRDRPSAVTLSSPENSSLKPAKNKGKTFNDLPREYQTLVNNIYKSVPKLKLSKDEYAQQLFESGVI